MFLTYQFVYEVYTYSIYTFCFWSHLRFDLEEGSQGCCEDGSLVGERFSRPSQWRQSQDRPCMGTYYYRGFRKKEGRRSSRYWAPPSHTPLSQKWLRPLAGSEMKTKACKGRERDDGHVGLSLPPVCLDPSFFFLQSRDNCPNKA